MERYLYKILMLREVSGKKEEKVEYAMTNGEMEDKVDAALKRMERDGTWNVFVYSLDHHGHGMVALHLVDFFIKQEEKAVG